MFMRRLAYLILLLLIIPILQVRGEDRLKFVFEFDSPTIKKVGNEYSIEIKGCYQYNYKGLVIPVKPLYILIPYKKEISKIFVRSKEEFLGNYPLQKEKNIIVGDKKIEKIEKIEKNEKIEKIGRIGRIGVKPTNKIDILYEKVGIYGLRGYNILVMNIFPISYDNGKVFYRKKMEIEIKLKNGKINPLYRGIKRDRKLLKFVENPWILDTYPIKDIKNSYDYLIITKEKFKDAFQRFADYKESKGIKTKIVSVEEIKRNRECWNKTRMFNDTQAKIRNFIKYAYLNWGIDYVLLGGDGDVKNESSNIIPPRYLYATCVGLPLNNQEVLEAYIPSDIYYACLDGNFNPDMDKKWGENATGNDKSNEDEADLFAEVFVGRACIDSMEEVNNFINKTISYENTNDSYIVQVLLLGEYLGFGGEAEWGGNHKDEIVPLIPEAYNITRMYDRIAYWDKYNLIPLLNKGVHIINHDGHGWTTYALKLYNSDLEKLNNTKYFFLYSQTCLAGSFDNWYPEKNYYEDDCFAEHLTLDKHGAFACIMNARYGLGRENSTDSPGQRFDLSFFEVLFKEREIGRTNHISKEKNVWRINENGMRWTYYQTNLFGDPQLEIKEPEEKINISIELIKPLNGIYLFDKGAFFRFLNKSIIFGGITIEVEVETEPIGKLDEVRFYINNELKAILKDEPFRWKWDEKAIGKYEISIVACAINGKCKKIEKEIYILNH